MLYTIIINYDGLVCVFSADRVQVDRRFMSSCQEDDKLKQVERWQAEAGGDSLACISVCCCCLIMNKFAIATVCLSCADSW